MDKTIGDILEVDAEKLRLAASRASEKTPCEVEARSVTSGEECILKCYVKLDNLGDVFCVIGVVIFQKKN